MDVVLGCLDNVTARLATDAGCWLFGVPWVEGGIAGYQGSVTVFVPPTGPCYRCTLSDADRANERQRFSCDQRQQRLALANQIPAVQTVSSVIAATQVQEALKLLQGQREPRTIFYDGQTNQMSQGGMGVLANHRLHHPTLMDHPIREEHRLSHETRLGEALRLLAEMRGGAEVTIRLDHPFITEAVCAACGHSEPVLRPLPRIWADEYQICPHCGSATRGIAERVEDLAIRLRPVREVSASSPAPIQALSLGQLGIPPLHILQARIAGVTYYVELTGDSAAVLGRWP
jgi:molybdopterin/thiamine biosynthesis adenylyltransferase